MRHHLAVEVEVELEVVEVDVEVDVELELEVVEVDVELDVEVELRSNGKLLHLIPIMLATRFLRVIARAGSIRQQFSHLCIQTDT